MAIGEAAAATVAGREQGSMAGNNFTTTKRFFVACTALLSVFGYIKQVYGKADIVGGGSGVLSPLPSEPHLTSS